MMNEAIIVAVLGCIGTIVGSGIGAIAASGKTNFRLELQRNEYAKGGAGNRPYFFVLQNRSG